MMQKLNIRENPNLYSTGMIGKGALVCSLELVGQGRDRIFTFCHTSHHTNSYFHGKITKLLLFIFQYEFDFKPRNDFTFLTIVEAGG